MGQLKRLSAQSRYGEALAGIYKVLQDRNHRQDILALSIRTFVELNKPEADSAYDLSPLRQVLEQPGTVEDFFARMAAAEAVGELADARSIPVLLSISSNPNEFHQLRLIAVQSLAKLGQLLQQSDAADQLVLAEMQTKLRSLIAALNRLSDDFARDDDLIIAAVSALGEVAELDDLSFLLPLLEDQLLSFATISAIQSLIVNRPESADQIVARFLESCSGAADAGYTANLTLVGLRETTRRHSTAERKRAQNAVCIALARAHRHEQVSVRNLAQTVLGALIAEQGAPRINALADSVTREQQILAWEEWFKKRIAE
jgi:HEAT repeat protein